MAQYYAEVGGKCRRETFYGKSRAEVAAKLTRAMADRDGGLVFDAGKLTLGEYLGRWLRESVKGTTHAVYFYINRKHVSPPSGT